MKEAEVLGIEYLVTHMGSHKKTGEEKGIKRFTSALNKILENQEITGTYTSGKYFRRGLLVGL